MRRVRLLAGASVVLALLVAGATLTPAKEEARPAPTTGPAAATEWKSLFDGKTLKGWKVTEFGGQGEPHVENGSLILPFGDSLTGVTYTGEVPKINYEVSLEAKRVEGSDFFCGLTFPVGDSHASLIVGGWGGSLIGISSLDDEDAARNETATNRRLEKNRWYRVRLRVMEDRLQAWLDDEKVVDVSTKGKKISIRVEVEPSKPFGIASWQTTAALRDIKLRKLSPEEVGKK